MKIGVREAVRIAVNTTPSPRGQRWGEDSNMKLPGVILGNFQMYQKPFFCLWHTLVFTTKRY